MSNTNYDLIAFKAISDFTKELCENFTSKDKNHSLKLYVHLLNKTTLTHEKAIKKHIDAFRDFCVSNRDAITNKNQALLVTKNVVYSTKVYINFSNIFKDADIETSNIIWKHLLTISALLDPAGKAKEILKNNKDSKEANFLSDIINKVESNVNPNSTNPLEAISSIMSSGVFNDLITGMNSGIQNGDLDLGKLMGTVQTMCASLSTDINPSSDSAENPMNMINNLMSTMGGTSTGGDGSIPDLSNITNLLGPMLSGLNSSKQEIPFDSGIKKKIKGPKNLSSVTEVNEDEKVKEVEEPITLSENNDLD